MPRPKKDPGDVLTLAVKDLLKNNQNTADIGTILGALGKDTTKWLDRLKRECDSIEEFIELAKQRADIELVAAAVREALGYDYLEIEQQYLKVADGYGEDNKPIIREVEGNRKTRKKRIRGNDALLRFILKCRLPEYFQDVQKVEINKKTIEIKEVAGRQIEEIGRKLLESINSETE